MTINYNNIEKIIEKLTSQNQTISFAESCTGGRIAVAFTSVSGASAVLDGSVVTYSNAIKHTWLGVDNEVLEKFGAVSSQCVAQMLEGIKNLLLKDIVKAVSDDTKKDAIEELKIVQDILLKQEAYSLTVYR